MGTMTEHEYDIVRVFEGKRWGAKRALIRLGLDPWMADAVLSSARTFGVHVYPWTVQGHRVGVGCGKSLGLLFQTHTYIVMVGK
jgi:hypothetical protein